jgi:uncharacterized protein YkwD
VRKYGIVVRSTSVDVQITLADTARFRVLPRNKFDARGKLIPFKPDKNDPDRRLGGVKGTIKDVEKDNWLAVKLRRNRSGSLHLADVVIVLGKEDKSTEKEKPAEKDRPSKRPDSAAIETDLVELLNRERAREKLPAVKVNPLLGKAARLHSENMAKQGKLTNVLDGKNAGDRLQAAGYAYDYLIENVAQGCETDTAAAIHALWMKNEGTRTNLLNARVTEVGIALAKSSQGNAYYTLVLATPRK